MDGFWWNFQDMSEKAGKRMKWLNFGSDPDHYMDLLDPWNVIFKDRYKWKNYWLAFGE